MYLKSLTITNFRKFQTENNTVYFVASRTKTIEETIPSNKNNVASDTTLIVGKNNSGKTTVTKALEKLLDNNKVFGNDFNFSYLKNLIDQYIGQDNIVRIPTLSFKLTVCIDNSGDDVVSNISPFMDIGALEASESVELEITVKYQIKEAEKFKEKVAKILRKNYSETLRFKKFLELIDKTDFKTKYFGLDGQEIRNNKFKISNLIEIKLISANKNLHATNLSSVFNRIIKNRYESEQASSELEKLVSDIDDINEKITEEISNNHNGLVNGVLERVESNDRLKVELSSDLTFDKLIKNLVKHEYSEFGASIPENQFGLGYTNLMNIIGEIIEYVDKYPLDGVQSKINLICIEEPETFMHPQMQESFIKFIDDAVRHLLVAPENINRNINSQLIITTHSSHILNSKIQSSNSFDSINYIASDKGKPLIVRLDDLSVSGNEKFDSDFDKSEEVFNTRKENELKFIKKHIKFKVSELFFADAVIFVEGITEETMLNYYLDQNDTLNKYYISICNINGAHGLVYLPLIKLLKIPILIITDLDIKRSDDEKSNFSQITDISDKETTNATLHKFNSKKKNISDLNNYITDDNLCCVFQKDKIEGFYATSFEEAFILSNFDNEILNYVLEDIKPKLYTKIVEPITSEQDLTLLKEKSFYLQKKLSSSKSDFANKMLYEFIVRDNTCLPELPEYITFGINWLKERVGKSLGVGTL